MKNKHPITLLLILIFGLSCSTRKVDSTEIPPLRSLTFEYSPPGDGAKDTSNIKFIIINPQYDMSFGHRQRTIFQTFLSSMKDDFLEMTIARGYTYRGPYDTRDEIVFSDKKFADLELLPIVEFDLSGMSIMEKATYNYLAKTYTYTYYVDATATLTGKLNLEIAEPFTSTKLWKKSIVIPEKSFPIRTYLRYTRKDDITLRDPGIWNPLVENLQEIYKKTLQTAWNHLDPEELKIIKQQSMEIRTNSGYNKK